MSSASLTVEHSLHAVQRREPEQHAALYGGAFNKDWIHRVDIVWPNHHAVQRVSMLV